MPALYCLHLGADSQYESHLLGFFFVREALRHAIRFGRMKVTGMRSIVDVCCCSEAGYLAFGYLMARLWASHCFVYYLDSFLFLSLVKKMVINFVSW
jgi:hypothetical protein